MANRTKHKPANSEQAARLLGKQPVFLSFDDASRALLSSQDSSPPPPNECGLSLDIDPEFQAIFRHLSKKDVNTKLKALQDFTQSLQSKDAETLEKASAYWQRMYRKLSNSTDTKIRLDSHLTHKFFISKLNRETLLKSYTVKTEENIDSQTSFQKLVTLPAVLWAACHEQSTQAAEASRQIFAFLYPNPEDKLQFLIDNHVTILNYCVYTMFQKIPFDLFYSSAISKDARQTFDEHLLVTTFMGLSRLINELLSAEDKQAECDKCIRTIFTVINREFAKSKQGFNPSTVKNNSKAPESAKEKKGKKKEGKTDENCPPDSTDFKFWSYEKVENSSVRIAFYSFLNSLTRLTTRLLQDSEKVRPDSDGTILWFKLYKNIFLNKVFSSFSDSVAQIRGHAWLLVTHILLNNDEFKPWSVVSHDKWKREVLLPFIQNGCKPREGVMDFGLINIVNKAMFPEFFSKKFSNQSAFKMICDSYSLTNVVENVKLITVFADAYQESFDVNKEDVYVNMISAFNTALSKAFLLSDAKFLVEVYFNLIYHFVLRNSTAQSNESLSKKFEQIFHKHIKNLIFDSFGNSQDILSNSHLSLNLLILIRNVSNDYKTNSASFSAEVFELFKNNILYLYTEILAYSNHWNDDTAKKNYSGFKNYLKCLNYLFFLQHDGYFSCEYYYLRSSTDYTKNFMNIFKSRCATEQMPKEKKVQFQVESDASDTHDTPGLSIEDTAFGHVSLFNPSFSDFKADSRAVLPDEFHALLEKFSVTVAMLCKKFNQDIANGLDESSMFLLYHLQYFFRIFEVFSKEFFFREMQITSLNEFTESYLLKWISAVVKLICKKENFTSLKLEMTILQKLFDWLLIATPTGAESQDFLSGIFTKMDSFAFILFVEHLDKLKCHQFSSKYEQKLSIVRTNIDESIYLRSLETEIGKIVSGQVSKIQLINVSKLLNTYLGQCSDAVKLEQSFHMLCTVVIKNCFDVSGGNWYYSRIACLYQKILDKINLKEVSDLDRFTSNLAKLVEYFLDKCLLSACSNDFTSEQFGSVYNFLKHSFQLFPIFAPKLDPILESFFTSISTQKFYHEQSSYSGNVDRLEFMEKVVNLALVCLKQLPETSGKVQRKFRELLEANIVLYRDDPTPLLFATEGDDAELKLLGFYEVLATDRHSILFQSDFMEKIKSETIASQFKISYFYYQSLILNRIVSELYPDQTEQLCDNPSGTILESLKNLFKVYFYFDQSFVMPTSQSGVRTDKQTSNCNNVEFGLFNEQLTICLEALTGSDPELKMKLFAFLVDIRNNEFNNVFLAFFLNQNFFFLDFFEIFEFFKIDTNDLGLMILNFLENRDYDLFLKNFEDFTLPEGNEADQCQELTASAHQKLLFMSYVLIWETSGDEQDMIRRVKNIVNYVRNSQLLEFVRNHPEEKVVASLFAKLVSEIATNALRQLRDFQILYDMISCLVDKIQKCILQQKTCLDFILSSRILKALIDCNQEICKQNSRMPILDWKMFACNIANNIILKIVFQMREFSPVDFIQDVFAKRIAHTVEWFDGQSMRLAKDIVSLKVASPKKLELEAKLDSLIGENKLLKQSNSGKASARQNMQSGSDFHDSIFSLYFGVLFHPNLQWSLAAYHVLSKTLQDLNRVLPEDNKEASQAQECGDSTTIEDDFLEPFKAVADYFHKLNAATHVIFDEYEFAEEVLLEPKTDLFDYALAYLLFWKLYLELVDSFSSTTAKSEKIRNDLIEFVTENNFHETLLQVLYHLMMNVEENLDPEDDDYVESFSVDNIQETFKHLDQITKFSDLSSMFRGKHISLLPRLAQIIYYQCLKTLPGIVRLWAGKQKKVDRELIDGFTLKYFTNPLVLSEYDRFHGEKDFGNIAIRFNKRDKDIFLVYTLNDICFKIKFSFPANYPLAALNVECLDHSGVSDEQTKLWIHRLNVFFSKQNCSIKDGIVMLKPNMDKFFENFDECMICLFVVYAATKELPKFRCNQCKKKFHVTCIRRWFHAGGTSTCPLCKFEFYKK